MARRETGDNGLEGEGAGIDTEVIFSFMADSKGFALGQFRMGNGSDGGKVTADVGFVGEVALMAIWTAVGYKAGAGLRVWDGLRCGRTPTEIAAEAL